MLLPTACGDGEDEPPAAPRPAPEPRARVLDVVALPLVEGRTDPVAVPVTLPAEARAYAARFPSSARGPLRSAIDGVEVPSGLDLRAAVVSVGCEEPAEVRLDDAGDGGWTVRAVPPEPTVQCLLPLTYVALVGVPA